MSPNPQEAEEEIEEILHGKFHILCSDIYRYWELTLILYTVVAYLYLLEYLADSFSDYKCARYCCFFYFGMGFSGEDIFGMLFSPPTRFYSFYIIRNHFIRNQIADFG